MASSNILSTLDNELYNKIKNFKKSTTYENIPYTIGHTFKRKIGPPKNPYSLISYINQTSDLSSKCFYDINGDYICKIPTIPKTKSKIIEKKQETKFFGLDRLFS